MMTTMTFDEWDSLIMDDYGFEYVDLEMKGRNQYGGLSLIIFNFSSSSSSSIDVFIPHYFIETERRKEKRGMQC